VFGRRVEHQAAMALVKRSPKMTANWAFAMTHSRGAIFHSFSERFKTRKRSREVASCAHGPAQLGVQRLHGIRGVEDAADVGREGLERHDLAPGAPPALGDRRIAAAPMPLLEGAERRIKAARKPACSPRSSTGER
jgi:hypothetical protein